MQDGAVYLATTPLEHIRINSLKGVGPKTAEHLTRLNIFSVADLLFHLPLRYEDRTRIATINSLVEGQRVLIEGIVQRVSMGGRTRNQLTCQLADDTGSINLRFFHFNAKQKQGLEQDDLCIRCFGEVRRSYRGGLEMIHPEYRQVYPASQALLETTLTPIYPVTQGLAQTSLRKLMQQALVLLKQRQQLVELLPSTILQKYDLPDLFNSLLTVHAPDCDIDQALLHSGRHPACKRLAFEELVAHQISLQRLRKTMRARAGYALQVAGTLAKQLINNLPYTLTSAQQRVLQEINTDLDQACPMLRLVQGDVGSGKTIVCALAALQAIEAGYQVAIMAPTELLAEQHCHNFKQWFNPLNIKVGWLTGHVNGKARTQTLQEIATGEFQIIVGTHALFSTDVQFQSLALLIIDEQHRFGVHQRLALSEKGQVNDRYPHQLIMSATPIPRTLAMSAYGDLDCSIIDELPPGRKPTQTLLISQKKRNDIIERVRVNCLANKQAYWVCTLIEESEALQCQTAEDTARHLTASLPELNIGLVHGRMKSTAKEAMMSSFKAGDIHLLVATTVIEVGVDVPQASLMIIENPERLGLAQMHQLRGRIGRGSIESFCVLLYKEPLTSMVQQRLNIMRKSSDGFVIAEHDLKMRGPGEVLGTRQAGLVRLKIADLLRDQYLLTDVKTVGMQIVRDHPSLIDKLLNRWIAQGEQFAQV